MYRSDFKTSQFRKLCATKLNFFSVSMKYSVTQGVFSSKPVQGKKFLETCRSKYVCRFPAVIISSKSIIQGLVNTFLTGYLLEKNRDYTRLYRNTYGSIFMKIFVTQFTFCTVL